MPDNRRVLLGVVAGAHGIRGEVVVRSFTADPADIAAYGPLGDATGTRLVKLRVLRLTAKGVIARIEGVSDRNAAEALKGLELYIDRAALPPADEDEYYHADLIGMTVIDTDGQDIGTVIAIQNYGAGDLLEYRLAGQKRTELLPFSSAFVPSVDLAARRVTIAPPPPDDEPGPPDAA